MKVLEVLIWYLFFNSGFFQNNLCTEIGDQLLTFCFYTMETQSLDATYLAILYDSRILLTYWFACDGGLRKAQNDVK